MYGTFEVTAYWRGKRQIRYFTVKLWNGIANRIYDEMEGRGFTHINVHLMA